MQSYIDELMFLEYVGVTNLSNYVFIQHLLEIPLCIIFANSFFNISIKILSVSFGVIIFYLIVSSHNGMKIELPTSILSIYFSLTYIKYNIAHHSDHLPVSSPTNYDKWKGE